LVPQGNLRLRWLSVFGAVRRSAASTFSKQARMCRLDSCLRFVTAVTAALIFATGANAQAPSWRFEQLYSNANLDIQFLVLVESLGEPNGNNQNAVTGLQIGSVHNDNDGAHDPGYVVYFTFPSNLPSAATAGRRILIGTQAFADLGLITPDFVVENQFLGFKNGLLRLYRGSITTPYDVAQYPQIPTDGSTALFRDAPNQRPNVAVNFAGQSASVPATPASSPTGVAVEYYYAAWDHYFVTSFPEEIAVLDGGAFGGVWKRTGQSFKVWTQGSATSLAACRFFSTSFAPKSSHFYTPFAAECASVKASPDWQFEAVAYFTQLADANGNCGAGTVPLYRLYNNGMGGAPNHRYTTSVTVLNQMIAAGWVFEGNGNTRVFVCVPQ